MLHYVQQLVAYFVRLLFVPGKVVHSGFIRVFIWWKQLRAENDADENGEGAGQH